MTVIARSKWRRSLQSAGMSVHLQAKKTSGDELRLLPRPMTAPRAWSRGRSARCSGRGARLLSLQSDLRQYAA